MPKPQPSKRLQVLQLLDGAEDLVMFRKSSGLFPGENLLTIYDDLENSPV